MATRRFAWFADSASIIPSTLGLIPHTSVGINASHAGIFQVIYREACMQFPKVINPSPTRRTGAEAIRKRLLEETEKSIEVISRLDDISFRSSNNGSSIGQQFRHNLDFLNTFLKGVPLGRIDYTRREREARVERERRYAIAQFDRALSTLSGLSSTEIGSLVSVRSEIDPEMWLQSTVVREMEFVLSHTVHHHALIAEKLSRFGVVFEINLGVAPSTTNYWSRIAA